MKREGCKSERTFMRSPRAHVVSSCLLAAQPQGRRFRLDPHLEEGVPSVHSETSHPSTQTTLTSPVPGSSSHL